MDMLKKPAVRIALGSVLTPSGSFMGYFYIANIGEVSPFFFILAFLMLPAGLYFLVKSLAPALARVERIETIDKSMVIADIQASEGKMEDKLHKNNAMLQDWNKTNKTRDELKLLQLSANVKSEAEK